MRQGRAAKPLLIILAGAVMVAGAILAWRLGTGPSSAGASPRRAIGASDLGEPIAITADVYDIPFAMSPDDEVSAALGSAETGKPRVVAAGERAEFEGKIRALRDSGRITALSAPRIAVLPRQPAQVVITSRPAAAPAGEPAREELSLALEAAWTADGVIELDAKFKAERVVGRVATVLHDAGLPSGERARAATRTRLGVGERLVVTRLVGDSRYVVVLSADKSAKK